MGDFSQIRGYLDWRYIEGKPYCYLEPANGDKFYVVGAVLGMEPSAWWTYYSANNLTFPANETYAGQQYEGLHINDQTCQEHGLPRPADIPPTPVPVAEVQIRDISDKFGPPIPNASGNVFTTLLGHVCLYKKTLTDTNDQVRIRLGLTAPGEYEYYDQLSGQYASNNNGEQGLYFINKNVDECH